MFAATAADNEDSHGGN